MKLTEDSKMRCFRLFLLIGSLFIADVFWSQCNVVPNASFTVQGDTVHAINLSTNTTSSTTYKWIFYTDAIDSSGHPGGTNTYTTNAFTPFPVYFSANGGYSVVLQANNGGSCATVSDSTFFIACTYTPGVTYTVGAGGNVTFSTDASGTSLTSIDWSFGDGGTANVNPTAHNYMNGTYNPSLQLQYSNGMCAIPIPIAAITITNHPCLANAAFTYTTAAGGAVFFSASTPADTSLSFYWYFGDGVSSNVASPTHIYGNGGNHQVQLTLTKHFPFCKDSSILNVNVTTVPCTANSNFNLTPSGNPHNYIITPSYPYNVTQASWNWGDGQVSSGTSIYASHTYSAPGNYNICLTVTTSCNSTSSTCVNQYLSKSTATAQLVYVSVQAPTIVLGVQEQMARTVSFNLYPNPTVDGIITIQLDAISEIKRLSVFDFLGKEVYELKTPEPFEKQSLDLSDLSNGIYFVRLQFQEKMITAKFVLSRH